ncbi:hypothetical protein ACFPPA_18470 [Rhodanobacter ginsengisoli]|uniref:Uncharacterized protein n=1 Tax=Rhodanobacter ginsengisoli TaxID=418646 RepID=A0ABW0QSI5_9GAMM
MFTLETEEARPQAREQPHRRQHRRHGNEGIATGKEPGQFARMGDQPQVLTMPIQMPSILAMVPIPVFERSLPS